MLKSQLTAGAIAGLAWLLGATALGFELPIPGSDWKGAVRVVFAGTCTEAGTSNAIPQFTVTSAEPQTIMTTNGAYRLVLQAATLQGTVSLTRHGWLRRLGPANQQLSFEVASKGYKRQQLSVPRNTILVDRTNQLDIVFQKE
jgi:hypothetical protein